MCSYVFPIFKLYLSCFYVFNIFHTLYYLFLILFLVFISLSYPTTKKI